MRKSNSNVPQRLYVAVTFRHSCLPVFAWRRVMLRFSTRNNCCEFLAFYAVNTQSVIQSFFTLYFKTLRHFPGRGDRVCCLLAFPVIPLIIIIWQNSFHLEKIIWAIGKKTHHSISTLRDISSALFVSRLVLASLDSLFKNTIQNVFFRYYAGSILLTH